jgi:hypothetical protein
VVAFTDGFGQEWMAKIDSICDSVVACGARPQRWYRLCTVEGRASNSLPSTSINMDSASAVRAAYTAGRAFARLRQLVSIPARLWKS